MIPVAAVCVILAAITSVSLSQTSPEKEDVLKVDRASHPASYTTPKDKRATRVTRNAWHDRFAVEGRTILYDNGPLVTHPGFGGAPDTSRLQNMSLGMATLGFNHETPLLRIADDFVITDPGGWHIDSICFYGYQTFTDTNSAFDAVNYRIWNGPPNDPTSSVLFGDTATNRLTCSTWSRIYRHSEGSPTAHYRPIMLNVVSAGITLGAGTYWLDWQSSGNRLFPVVPWAPPITIIGDSTTGNALQYNGFSWRDAQDTGTLNQQGFPFLLKGGVATSVDRDVASERPVEFILHQNFPNPFNPSTTIQFQVPSLEFVRLKVYDLLGREVATLVNERLSPGTYNTTFDGSDIPSGVYLYRLSIATQVGRGFIETKRLTLLR